MKKFFLAFLALHLTGCGFFMSGKWENDPKNWERVFGEKAPPSLVIHHSYYERSPHPITWEFTCFFEIEDSKVAREYFGFDRLLKPTSSSISTISFIRTRDDRAPWFPCGESTGEFEIWRSVDCDLDIAVVDKKKQRIFFSARR